MAVFDLKLDTYDFLAILITGAHMANILYVHGFGSNKDSQSFQDLKAAFPEHNFYTDTFELLNIDETLSQIDSLCKQNKISIIIGKSLGGFYTLAYKGSQYKMVINPCIKPWIEIPKLNQKVSEETLSKWETLFTETEKNIHSINRADAFGIFADNDELFSYKDYFDDKYLEVSASLKKSYLIPGKHHIEIENLKIAVQKGFDYFSLRPEYDDVFELMPAYQMINILPDDDDYFTEEQKNKINYLVDHYHNRMVDYQNKKIFGQ